MSVIKQIAWIAKDEIHCIYALWEKKGILQLTLQFNFWVVKNTYNSLYLYVASANWRVAWITELQLIIYAVQFIAIQL